MSILERDVSRYLACKINEIGGETRRVEWIHRRDAPDWVVFYNGTHWVETKRPGEKPRPSQRREFARLERHGAYVHVLDTKEEVDRFIWKLTSTHG